MLGLKNKTECVGGSCSIMMNIVTTQGCCCGRWHVEFNQSGTVPTAFQNEEKVGSRRKKGFVEEVSSELTFRNKSNVVTGNPGLVFTERAEEITGSEVKSTVVTPEEGSI